MEGILSFENWFEYFSVILGIGSFGGEMRRDLGFLGYGRDEGVVGRWMKKVMRKIVEIEKWRRKV